MKEQTMREFSEIAGCTFQEALQESAERERKENQLTTEDRYETSDLRAYFELESWKSNEALLILCGIDPQAVLIHKGYRNFLGGWVDAQQIEHAKFFGERDNYDIPSENEINSWIKDSEKVIKKTKYEIEEFKKYGDCISGDENYISIRDEQLKEAEVSLGTCKEFLSSIYFNEIWNTRLGYARKLTRIKAIWESGDHAEKNAPNYFIDWALGKGLEVSWLNWAQEQGFFAGVMISTTESGGTTSEYLNDLQRRVDHLANKYPDWATSTNKIQNTGNLVDWIKSETGSNSREAEIIKTALIEIIPELKKR